MTALTHAQLLEVQDAIVSVGLENHRAAMQVGLPTQFAASFPNASTPSAQLLLDLQMLNNAGVLEDGRNPFAIWLSNAIVLAVGRRETVVFKNAQRICCGAATSAPLESPKDAANGPMGPIDSPPSTPSAANGAPSMAAPASANVLRFLAPVVAALILLGVSAALYFGRSREQQRTIVPEPGGLTGQCDHGRQTYRGACIRNDIVDFLTCVEGCSTATARQLAAQALANSQPADSAKNDDQIRERLENNLRSLPRDDLLEVIRLCNEAPGRAGVSMPTPPPVAPTVQVLSTQDSLVESTDESKALDPARAYLKVISNDEALVYVAGRSIGPTNQRHEVACGSALVRIGRALVAGTVDWRSAPGFVMKIPCRTAVTVSIAPSSGPWPTSSALNDQRPPAVLRRESHSTTQSDLDSTGVDECDKYFNRMNDCFATNPAAKAAMADTMTKMREVFRAQAATPSGKDALVAQCRQHMTLLDTNPMCQK